MNNKKRWMVTKSGLEVDPLDLHPWDICFDDIAWSLSMQCRYNGHCPVFYSVAQHSVLVAIYLDNHRDSNPDIDMDTIRHGLLHDAAEAYIGDIIVSVKAALPEIKEIEDRALAMILDNWGLEFPQPPIIKDADNVILATERRDIITAGESEWTVSKNGYKPSGHIHPWNQRLSYGAFVNWGEHLGLI